MWFWENKELQLFYLKHIKQVGWTNMETLIELIPSLGFPIVCCVAIGVCFYRILMMVLADGKERENNLMNLTREISTKIAELGQIVDKNTEAISVMNEKIEKISDELEDVKKWH